MGWPFTYLFCQFTPIGISSQVLPSRFRPVFFFTVGSAHEVPVVAKDGRIKPGWRMEATISVDHRVSDGVEAARREACRNWQGASSSHGDCWCKNIKLQKSKGFGSFSVYGIVVAGISGCEGHCGHVA